MKKIISVAIAFLDFLMLQVSLILAYLLWVRFPWHGNWQFFSEFSQILWILPPLGVIVFVTVGLYKEETGVIGVEEQSQLFKAVWIVYLVVFAFSFFYRKIDFSRLAVFYSMFIALVLLTAERFFVRRALEWLNQKGIAVRRAVIYGAGYHGQRLERWIHQSPKLGIQILGYLDDDPGTLQKKPATPILGDISHLKKLVKEKKVNLFFLAHRKTGEEKVVEIFQLCRKLGIQCWIIPSLYAFHIERARISNIGGIPLVTFRESYANRFYQIIKRFFDLTVSLFLIILTFPVMAVIAVVMRASAGSDILFRQTRVGLNGKKFVMLKFRTLTPSTKDDVSPELKGGSGQVLPFGGFLRRTGLDELPQLLNVVMGDMSLVGPRPEMPFIVKGYGPLERERLSVKPGITGLWQVSEDRKRLLIHENMDYDLYYIEHFSFNLDLAILLRTFFVVAARFFGRTAKSSNR